MKEYIDRDAIQKRINRIVEVNNLRTDLAWFTPYGVKALIEEIPAADVRPVVRRRWVGNKRHQSCSECHMTYCVPDGLDGELDMTAYHFCPNCGADMREES